jgi:arginase
VHEGALDWMGLAHMLAEPGAVAGLTSAGGPTPLLEAEQVLLFGWGPEQATPFEREVIQRRSIEVLPVDDVAADPEAAATNARRSIERRCDRVLVHFDVDVIDFTDVPLSENWGRNEGLSYEDALRALAALLASPRLAGLTITELNPDHAERGSGSIERFTADVTQSLADALTARRRGRHVSTRSTA